MGARGISRPVAQDISGDDRLKRASVSAGKTAAAGVGRADGAASPRDTRAMVRSWKRDSWSERWLAVGRAWAALRAREASLELWRDGIRLQRLPLGAERIRIGRDPLCELVADAEGVSRVHCFVESEHPGDRDPHLEDFNSANGVFWRDQRIRAIRLRHGDAVRLGLSLIHI